MERGEKQQSPPQTTAQGEDNHHNCHSKESRPTGEEGNTERQPKGGERGRPKSSLHKTRKGLAGKEGSHNCCWLNTTKFDATHASTLHQGEGKNKERERVASREAEKIGKWRGRGGGDAGS